MLDKDLTTNNKIYKNNKYIDENVNQLMKPMMNIYYYNKLGRKIRQGTFFLHKHKNIIDFNA